MIYIFFNDFKYIDFTCKSKQVFKMADNVWVFLMLTFGSTCTPLVCWKCRHSWKCRSPRHGLLPISLPLCWGIPPSVPLSDLMWANHSFHCILECAAINRLQVLFFGVLVTDDCIVLFLCEEHNLFKTSSNSNQIFIPPGFPLSSWGASMSHMLGLFQNVCGRIAPPGPPSSLWLEWSSYSTPVSAAQGSLLPFQTSLVCQHEFNGCLS